MASIFDFFLRSNNNRNIKIWDLIIIGAGPIGLTSAKIASEKGLEVLVLEKQKEGNFIARAETVESNETKYYTKNKSESFSIINDIWGDNFLEELKLDYHNKNIFYPPMTQEYKKINKITTVEILENPYNFDWHDFIKKMTDIVKLSSNVTFIYNLEVKEISETNNDKLLLGIKTNKGEFYGKTLFDCAGHNSPFASTLGIDYSKLNNPAIKTKFLNFPEELAKTFHTFYIPCGSLNSFKNIPPAMLVIFPCRNHKNKYAEINCQFFTEYGSNGYIYSNKKYSNKKLMEYWEAIKLSYPVFSDMIKKCNLKEEYLTYIPCQKMLDKAIYKPGIIKIGDSAGFVRPNSSSGIVMGMKAAKYWAERIACFKNIKWNTNLAEKLDNEFKKEDFYIYLKNLHRKTRFRKNLAYDSMKTPEGFNNYWNLIVNGYRRLEKNDAMNITDEEFEKKNWSVKLTVINTILQCNIITPLMREKLLRFLEISKKSNEWDMIFADLSTDMIFKKFFNRGGDIKKIYDIVGDLAPVLHAIALQNKKIIINKIDNNLFNTLKLQCKTDLLDVLINRPPLGNKGERKVLDFLKTILNNNESGKKEFIYIVNNIGDGINTILKRFHGNERVELVKLFDDNNIYYV